MSPRTPTKTVTLYDFKQKTIAYKDLTNKECFLGRLTSETLNEETRALTKIQNPVERQPKVLYLDPKRSSLTPTQIRNMVGQKTAIFCGKMNTYLLLPKETHSLHKRAVEEIEERTFHRQGHHTVHYSHFGRETRKRYRKPIDGQLFHTKVTPDWKVEDSETKNGGELSSNSSSLENGLLKIDGKEMLDPALVTANYNFGKTALPSESLDEQNKSNLYFPVNHIVVESHHQDENERNPQRFLNFSNFKGMSTHASSVSENKQLHPIVHTPLSDFKRTEQSQQNLSFDSRGNRFQNEAESGSVAFGFDLNTNRIKLYPQPSIENVIRDNVYESSNVLKATESIDHQPLIPQANEDIHDVFEGFFNLGNNNPSSKQLSHFIPSGPSGKRHNYSDEYLFSSNYHNSQIKRNNDTDRVKQWKEHKSITSTDHQGFSTTPNSNNNEAISPTYFNSFLYDRALKFKLDKAKNLISNQQKNDQSNKSPIVEKLQPVSSNYENLVDEYFTTENPYILTEKNSFNFESNVSQRNEMAGNIASTSLKQNLPGTPNFLHSGIHKSIASQNIRLQNVLRSYKPDQIIIDVENIPTQISSEATFSLQGQMYPLNSSRNIGDNNEARPIRNTSFLNKKRQPLDLPIVPRIPSFPRLSELNLFQAQVRNNIRQRIYLKPQTLSYRGYNSHRSYKSGRLLSDVSIHPRHSKAPYANIVHSEALPPTIHEKALKLHRHRHYKKKDRVPNPCCSKNCCKSCCIGKSLYSNSPCCSSRNEERQTKMLLANTTAPQQIRKPLDDPRSRCQKEKMCRTLYESTQQVIVCRNAKINGC